MDPWESKINWKGLNKQSKSVQKTSTCKKEQSLITGKGLDIDVYTFEILI